MSIVGSGVPTNRSNIQLPNEVSSEILQKTQESSMIMRLAQQMPLPGWGAQIPVILGDPTPNWVAETGAKPVSNPTLDKKIMVGNKLAVIVPFSMEFRRDAKTLYDMLVARLPAALGRKFDETVFFGPPIGTTLSNFDDFHSIAATSLQSSVYGGLVSADAVISEAGGVMNGIVLSPQGRSMLLGALDTTNRPIFTNTVRDGDVPMVLGARTYVTGAAYQAGATGDKTDPAVPDIVGVAGDWSKALWGTVEGVQITYSEEATLPVQIGTEVVTVNLFQQNMFAVRAEIEVGFVAQTDYFTYLTRTHAGE